MNFWKRFRWVVCGLLIGLWLIAVSAGSLLGDGSQRARPLACTTNCL
jgi:hypothetical protein